MTWEHWILLGAAVAVLASLGGCLLLVGVLWFTRGKAGPATVPAPTTEGGRSAPSSSSSDLLLAAFRMVKAEGEIEAARAFAGDLRAAEAEAARAGMGRTLSPKAGGPPGQP
ncbi:hypothetical protein [Paludisphaera soli]|uniref:hypothetical protein n=1 Tax=Paludisphaera soli TaxID=2712865 RepID=UPI0013E9EAE7|nr:hypothetical protein [Paludisphaera soli]